MITYIHLYSKTNSDVKLDTKRSFTEFFRHYVFSWSRPTLYASSKQTPWSDAKQTIQAWSCDNSTERTCQWNLFQETHEVIRLNMVHSRMWHYLFCCPQAPQDKIRHISQVTQFSQGPCWSTKARGNGNYQVQESLEIELQFAQSAQGAVGNEGDKKNK